MKDLDSLKVAIVCDWLTGVGGAERVVLEMHKLFPLAPIYTSQYDPVALPWFNEARVNTLWLQKLPKSFKKFMPPLRAWAFSSLDLSAYDLVLSSSGAEAKGIKVKPGAVHITYCHAPTHYYWSRYDQYLANPGLGKFDRLAKLGLKLLVNPMRKWDHKAAQGPKAVITNSSFTQYEVNKYYGRLSTVIHPPVDVERFAVPPNYVPQPRSGFVITGRQTPYKRVDLAVEACTQLNVPLTVIGNGPDHQKLMAMAGPSIKFLTDITDLEMPNYLRSAQAFIFPCVDDFGISAVEAMAAGTPVIAFKGGGALDYVVEGSTGLFFENHTVESLVKVLKTFTPHDFNEKIIIAKASEFSTDNFINNLSGLISQDYEGIAFNMCGIVGYIGPKQAQSFLLEGLATLEYRGYDSTGLVVIDKNKAQLVRSVGRVESVAAGLQDSPLHGNLGIGHTRWATHGAPLEKNAHPHADSAKQFFVVHNGIVENFQDIKSMLQEQGVTFHSDTDTEVIPQLIAAHYKSSGDVKEAFLTTIRSLKGAFSIVMVTTLQPGTLYAARLSSPLVIGVGEGENFIASDPTPIMEHTKKVIFLNDHEAAVITHDSYEIIHVDKGKTDDRQPEELDYDPEQALLGDYPHFMLKEIYEAPQTVRSALLGRLRVEQNLIKLGGLEMVEEQLRYIDRIIIVACGTSYYASLVGEYLIEEIAGIPVEVQQASEFKYRKEPLSRSTVVIAVSQSGETADTLAALEKVAGYGVLRLGVVNAVGSSIARMTDAGVYCHAGSEQSVASTKAFIAQVSVLALIALHLSDGNTPLYKALIKELDALPQKIEDVLKLEPIIKEMAHKYSHHRDFLYIGRRYMYPVALEGALKLKELSYIHAEGFAGGEMKHGPLAMIDENFPTMALALNGELFEKTMSNIQEIKARGGPVLAICNDAEKLNGIVDDCIVIPETIEQLQPLLAAIPMQLFAYHTALALDRNVDRPRNLAKSVTVE